MMETLQKYYESLIYLLLLMRKKIKLIQKNFKKYLQEKNIKLRGPALYNRKLCNNAEDFYLLN